MKVRTDTFLLDANVFIEANRRYYAFDLCPGFWKALESLHTDGRTYSIDRVLEELKVGGDGLAEWSTEAVSSACFLSTDDPSVVNGYREIVTWVTEQHQFRDEAKAEFQKIADGWLTAYAREKGMVLVTQEVYNRDVRKKIPMPNICRQFNISYVNTFDMLRQLGVQFHWEPN